MMNQQVRINKLRLYNHVLLFLITAMPATGITQSHKIDSLKAIIQSVHTPEIRLKNILQLCLEKNSLRGDTLYIYALKAKALAQQLNDKTSEAWADYNILAQLLANGKADSLLMHIDKYIKEVSFLNDRNLYYKAALAKANALNRNNKLNEALELQLHLFTEAEKEKNIESVIFLENYIGATYLNLNNTAEAKNWWEKGIDAIKRNDASKYSYIEATILGNLGLLYYNRYITNGNKEIADSGIAYLSQSIDIAKKGEFMGTLASGLVLKGNFLSGTGKLNEAEQYFTEGISIRNKIGDPFYIMQDLINLGSYYYAAKQYQKSIAAIKEGIAVADANNVKADRLQLIGVLAYNYKALNNYEEYSKVLEQYIAQSDSNNRINATKQLAEIQTKYDVQKKETLIAQQKLDLLQRKLLLYGGVLLVAIIAFILAYRFKKYKQQQKIKTALLLDERNKQEELAIKDAEENERKRIASELHDNLGVQANAILHNSTLLNEETGINKNIVTGLQETAKEMLLNLRETLWAMKTADVTATELWLRIINFMKQMGRHYHTINFKVEGTVVKNLMIPSNKALHIVLVLQEIVNNAIKHAGATFITATTEYCDNELTIVIQDNGKGFDLNTAIEKEDSYGLKNIQKRAVTGNFKYTIDTAAGKGTKTTITI